MPGKIQTSQKQITKQAVPAHNLAEYVVVYVPIAVSNKVYLRSGFEPLSDISVYLIA